MITQGNRLNVQPTTRLTPVTARESRRITARELAQKTSTSKARTPAKARPNAKLIRERERFNLSQIAVADANGIASSSIINYEKGGTVPNVVAAIKLARFYETSVEDLFGSLVDDDGGAR